MNVLKKLLKVFNKQSLPLLCLWGFVGIFFIGNIIFVVLSKSPESLKNSPVQPVLGPTIIASQEAPVGRLSAFDGLSLDEQAEESIVSVMVDNFVTARTQHSGVRSASIVYEALAEGGITRLMLIFPYQVLPRVGPVRSAREYFVDFAEEYGGLYLHAGGAPSALEKLKTSTRLYNFDEDDLIQKPSYSFRDSRYEVPHNLFMDLGMVRLRAESNGWKLSEPKVSFCFRDEVLGSGEKADQLEIDFSSDPLAYSSVVFEYDDTSKSYKRFYKTSKLVPHTDQFDGLQVSPSTIIVQISPTALIPNDEKERIEMNHVGSGLALLYRNGTVTRGQWRKDSLNDVTHYETDTGESFCLQPGQTWIAIVDSENVLTIQ